MRKSTIFISSVLTTFALVMLYEVVTTYRNISSGSAPSVAQVVETATTEPTEIPASVTPSFISPEQAAQLAAAVVGNSNLLSAESSTINGVPAYMITFTNNDLVYVGLDGQILGVQVAPVVQTIVQPVQAKNNKNSGGNGGGGEDHDDEEHDD
jgi:hypothetical protein